MPGESPANGERRGQFITHDVTPIVSNVAATVDFSKRKLRSRVESARCIDRNRGLDNEAFSASNAIQFRKGPPSVQIRAGGNDRDRAVHDDATVDESPAESGDRGRLGRGTHGAV